MIPYVENLELFPNLFQQCFLVLKLQCGEPTHRPTRRNDPASYKERGGLRSRASHPLAVDSSKSEGRNDSMLKRGGRGKRSLVRGQLFTKRFLCTTSTQLALQPQVNKRKRKAKKGQHGFWPSPENQLQFLDTISASLGVTKVLFMEI